jgi:hypothetical protein
MFCPQCGETNAENAANCKRCGRVLQQPATLTAQPGQIPVATVPNYLVFAILTTVLCCLPAGIPAIVYAAQVNSKLQAGNVAGAQEASRNAKMWCWIALAAGLLFMVAYGLFVALTIMRHHRY